MSAEQAMVLRAAFVLPLSDSLGRDARIEDGYVLTRGDVIAEVGHWSPEVEARLLKEGDLRIIGGPDAQGGVPCRFGVILPGFVKAHGHDHESPIIGVAKDEPLTSWLDHAVNLFSGLLAEEGEALQRQLGRSPRLVTYLKARLDDVSFGITTSMVHHCNHNKYFVSELHEANAMAGTRMLAAMGSQDRHYEARILDTPEQAVARLDRALAELGRSDAFSVLPGPDQFFSNGPDMLRALKAWSREHGTLAHIHSSEEPKTTAWFRATYGMTPVEYGDSVGFLDERTVVAHQVNCTDHDLELLRDRGVKVVHNPLANTILGSGMPPIIKMMAMGIPVAISTDGSGSADNQNILSAARLAAQYQKALHQDASLLPAQRLLELITIEPARMLGLPCGSLEPGLSADLVYLDLDVPHLTPTRVDNVVENLIWASTGTEVRHVMARGRLLMEGGETITLDRCRILDEVRRLSAHFAAYRLRAGEIRGTGAHH